MTKTETISGQCANCGKGSKDLSIVLHILTRSPFLSCPACLPILTGPEGLFQ